MAENKQNLQSSEVLAKLFEVTPRQVQKLAKAGILPVVSERPYQFDLFPAIKAYIRYLSGKQKGEDVEQAEADKLRAEADLKQSKAKIAEMQLKELEGKMHRSEDVEAATNDLVYTIRAAIMSLPGRLAMDVVQADTANEASAIIRAECYKILNELAAYQYDPEVYRRRVRDREGWSEPFRKHDDEDDE